MEELEESNKAAMKKGKGSRTLSGRALFHYDPSLFVDDEGAADASEVGLSDVIREEEPPSLDNAAVFEESLFLDDSLDIE